MAEFIMPSMANQESVEDLSGQIGTLNNKTVAFPNYSAGYNKQSQSFTATENGFVLAGLRCTDPRLIVVSVNSNEVNRTYVPVVGGGTVFSSYTPLIPVKNGDSVYIDYQVIGSVGTVYQTLEWFFPMRT